MNPKYISEELQDLLWAEGRSFFVGWLQGLARDFARRNRNFERALNFAERAADIDLDGDGDIAEPGVPGDAE